MRVLAIDPGNELSAWCVVDAGALFGCGKVPNAELLERLRAGEWNECLLAVEMIASYGMPVGREVFETCLWIGRFVEAFKGAEHRLIYRRDVKLFHCESVRATDANIRAALIDRYGPGKAKAIGTKKDPGPLYGLKGDEWSALAVALAAAVIGARLPASEIARPDTIA
jgi:hypothetical protein